MSIHFNSTFHLPVPDISLQSQWRRDFEAYRAAQRAVRPRFIVSDPVAPRPSVKRMRASANPGYQFCRMCFNRIKNKHGICPHHRRVVRAIEKFGPAPQCEKCGAWMRRDSVVLICMEHGRAEYKRQWWQTHRKKGTS